MSAAVTDLDATSQRLARLASKCSLTARCQLTIPNSTPCLAKTSSNSGNCFLRPTVLPVRLHALTDGYLESDGIIESRTQGLTSAIDGINDDREALNERLASLETRLLRQFNALGLFIGATLINQQFPDPAVGDAANAGQRPGLKD